MHLEEGVFFDKETFGADRLVPQKGLHYFGLAFAMENVSQMPIAEAARKDLLRLQHARVDYLPDLTPEQKRRKLIKTSYKDFLLQYCQGSPRRGQSPSNLDPRYLCRRNRCRFRE